MLENGDQVEILASEAQHPQPSWLRFVATGKARAGVRRFVRHKEREETIELGRKIYDEIVQRLPAELDKDAQKRALKKLKIENADELMIAIARKRVSDEALMEVLMPGSAGGDVAPRPIGQKKAISIKGLTPGVAYHLAQCCHPIPGDRIVGLRREDEEIEVHVIGCDTLASGIDADWLDLAWGEGSDGGAARSSFATSPVRSAPCPAFSGPSTRTSSTCSWSIATAASRPSTSTSKCMTLRTFTRSSPRFEKRIPSARSSESRPGRPHAAGVHAHRRPLVPQA
jgi:hypothetical protein